MNVKEVLSPEVVTRLQRFSEAVFKVQDMVELSSNPLVYDDLSNAEKIKFNLLLSCSLNSLFWMYLRAEGIDPSKHKIRLENERLQKAMARAKQINDRNTFMPRVNKDATKRFIRNSLWMPKEKRQKITEKN